MTLTSCNQVNLAVKDAARQGLNLYLCVGSLWVRIIGGANKKINGKSAGYALSINSKPYKLDGSQVFDIR